VEHHVARPLGLRVEEAAEAMVRVANANMAGALRLVSVARGRDPRRFALVAAGGAGPMHACRVADALGVGAVVVPTVPGICAALGLLLTDVRYELRRSLVRDLARLDVAELDRSVAALEHDAAELLATHGEGGEVGFSVDLRYRGQAYNLTVPLAPRPVTPASIAAAAAAFAAAHVEAYDYTPSVTEVELVTIRAHAVLPAAAALPAPPPGGRGAERAREVTAGGERRRYAVVDRSGLGPGGRISPETIVEQEDATVVVPAGWDGEVAADGTIVLGRTH
jgi:N-methylhydantoinase A